MKNHKKKPYHKFFRFKPKPVIVPQPDPKDSRAALISLKKLQFQNRKRVKRILAKPKRLIEFLTSEQFNFIFDPIEYKKHPIFKYLIDVYTTMIRRCYEINKEVYNETAQQNKAVEFVMSETLKDEKKKMRLNFKKLLKIPGTAKYKIKRLREKIRTNYGYRRFYNVFELKRTKDEVEVPVKPLNVVDDFILNRTLNFIPKTLKKLKKFTLAFYKFQKLAYIVTHNKLQQQILKRKSSIQKYVNQLLFFLEKNPFVTKKLAIYLKTKKKTKYFKPRKRKIKNLRKTYKHIFERNLLKNIIVPSFSRKFISPGKRRYLRRRYTRLLQRIVNKEYNLRSRYPLKSKDIRRYAFKIFTNIGWWTRVFAEFNLNTFATRTYKNVFAKLYSTNSLIEQEQDDIFIKKYLNTSSQTQKYFLHLAKKVPNMFSGESFINLLKKKYLVLKTLRKKFNNKLFVSDLNTKHDFFYLRFLNTYKRIMSKSQFDEMSTLSQIMRTSLKTKNVTTLAKILFASNLKNVISKRTLKPNLETEEMKQKRYKAYQHLRNPRFWLSNSLIPPFRIIMRQSTNNFFVTATMEHGRVINNFTSGLVGLKGPSRSTGFAASQVGRAVGSTLTRLNIGPSLCIFKSPVTGKLRTLTVGIYSTFKQIKAFYDLIPRSHNGLRLPKPRRL